MLETDQYVKAKLKSETKFIFLILILNNLYISLVSLLLFIILSKNFILIINLKNALKVITVSVTLTLISTAILGFLFSFFQKEKRDEIFDRIKNALVLVPFSEDIGFRGIINKKEEMDLAVQLIENNLRLEQFNHEVLQREALISQQLIYWHLNYKKRWLMPIFTLKFRVDSRTLELFNRLTLQEWENTILNEYGELESSKFLFITWDLRRINKWARIVGEEGLEGRIEHIARFLSKLKEKAERGELRVNRILILSRKEMEEARNKKILRNIFESYFKLSVHQNNYKIKYIFYETLQEKLRDFFRRRNKEGANANAYEFVELFLDVAFFMKKEPTEENEIWPSTISIRDVNSIQISHRMNPCSEDSFLYLFLIKNEDNEEILEKIIQKFDKYYREFKLEKELSDLSDLLNINQKRICSS